MLLPLLHQSELGLARDDVCGPVSKGGLALLVREDGDLGKPVEGERVEDEPRFRVLVQTRCLGRAEPALEPVMQHKLQLEDALVIRPICRCRCRRRGRRTHSNVPIRACIRVRTDVRAAVPARIWHSLLEEVLEQRTQYGVHDDEVRKWVHDHGRTETRCHLRESLVRPLQRQPIHAVRLRAVWRGSLKKPHPLRGTACLPECLVHRQMEIELRRRERRTQIEIDAVTAVVEV